jgi:hypothetical protein
LIAEFDPLDLSKPAEEIPRLNKRLVIESYGSWGFRFENFFQVRKHFELRNPETTETN